MTGSASGAAEDIDVERIARERQRVEGRIETCRREIEAQEDPADAALDIYSELRNALRGAEGRGLGELNERLRENFEEFRTDTMDDGVIGVLPVLRRREFDWWAAYSAWAEAGKPEPTPEEIAEARTVERAQEPIWATGKEMIRPPRQAAHGP